MGWLVDKLKNGRVYMAIKELKSDVDVADDARRAKILLRAQHARREVIEAAGLPLDILDNPQKYPHDARMNVVGQLEEVILQGESQLKVAVSHAKTIGMDGKLMQAEMLFERRALQVWIATLGATDKHEADVKDIWAKLSKSTHALAVVVNEMEAMAKLSAGLSIDAQPKAEDSVRLRAVMEMCSFVPSKYKL